MSHHHAWRSWAAVLIAFLVATPFASIRASVLDRRPAPDAALRSPRLDRIFPEGSERASAGDTVEFPAAFAQQPPASPEAGPTLSKIASQSLDEDTTISVSFGLDWQGSGPTVTATSSNQLLLPNSALVLGGSGNTRSLTITPVANGNGDATVTITATNNKGTDSTSFKVTVRPVNDPPTISPIADVAFDQDTTSGPIAFTIGDIESGASTLQVGATSSNATLFPPGNLMLGGSTGSRTLTLLPTAKQTGTATITVTVQDPEGATAATSFKATVRPVNRAPTLGAISDRSSAEDTPVIVGITIGDPNDDVSTLRLGATSSNTALVPNTNLSFEGAGTSRSLRIVPAANASGTTTITVTVSDPAGAQASRSFILTVVPVNDEPTISAVANQATLESTPTAPIGFTVADVETPAAALVVSASSSNAALVPNNGAALALGGSGAARTLVITPASGQSGTATITLRVTDTDGATSARTFLLTVTAVDDPPTISVINPRTTPEDTPTPPIAFTIGDVDTPVSSLVLSAASSDTTLVPVANVVLSGSGTARTVVVTPAPDRSGTVTISITVRDATSSRTTSFALTVTPVNDPPVIGPIADQQTPEETPTPPIAFTVTDVDNAPAELSVTATSSNHVLVPDGAIALGGAGTNRTITLTPDFGQAGTTTVTITVRDPGGLAATRQFALTVTDVPCTYTLSQPSMTIAAGGGTVTTSIATRPGCAWTISTGAPWIHVLAPSITPVFGDGGVALGIDVNATGATRSGIVNIGSSQLTVTQPTLACGYGLIAAPSAFAASGGEGTLTVNTTPGCSWTALAVDAWVIFARVPAAGVGPGSVAFTVAANEAGQPRTTSLSAGGQTAVVSQAVDPTSADGDGDGLPDAWEEQFGLNAGDVSGDNGPAGDPDHDGVSNLDEYRRGTHPRGFNTRYLAEGATGQFFTTLIALANPGTDATARVLLRFLKPDGSTASTFVAVPPRSRRTVDPGSVPGLESTAFATTIESDVPVVIDRTMTWDARGYGAHSETSIEQPRMKWYFAEGATHSGFDLFYLLQNPSATDTVTVQITYLRPAALDPLTKLYTLEPGSRTNVWVNVEEFPVTGSGDTALANTDVSAIIEVLQGPPITAERAMYMSRPGQLFAAGHDSAAIPEPSTEWFLAEGSTEGFFDEFVLVANPNPVPARIHATFLLPNGRTVEEDYDVGPNSRFNIWLNAAEIPKDSGLHPLAGTAVSTIIRSTDGVPVIAERAMWWPSPASQWTEGNNAAGTTFTGTAWATAEGEVGGPRHASTYLLIANPSGADASVRVTLLFEDGTTATRDFVVVANSRWNVDVGTAFADTIGDTASGPRRFGTLVESLPVNGASAAPVVVERSMFWDSEGVVWAAGANAVATKIR